MEGHGVAAAISSLLGLPSWAPRAARDAAVVVLLAVLLLAPDTFKAAVTIAVERETARLTELFTPAVPGLTTPAPAPAPAPVPAPVPAPELTTRPTTTSTPAPTRQVAP